MADPIRAGGRQFLLSLAVSFLLLFVGFRIFYDSVIPEVAGLIVAGLVLGSLRPQLWWVSALGLCAGIVLSERVFPATPSAAHVAQYGPPKPAHFGDMLILWAFPTVGTVLGGLSRVLARALS